jgi:hypothetical protein
MDNMFADPLVQNDYVLAVSSPCIDAGLSVRKSPHLSKDFKRKPVLIGVRDIGAVEKWAGHPQDLKGFELWSKLALVSARERPQQGISVNHSRGMLLSFPPEFQ